jgi:uncharacterized protein
MTPIFGYIRFHESIILWVSQKKNTQVHSSTQRKPQINKHFFIKKYKIFIVTMPSKQARCVYLGVNNKMTSEQTIVNRETKNYEAAKIIGLISDTHVPKRAMCIPKKVFEIFANADFVIHAGDLVELAVIDELEQAAPVLAVHGNMDGLEVNNAFPKVNSLKIFDWKIGVIHDADNLHGPGNIKDLVEENQFNVLVHGHTHSSKIKWIAKTLYINPGSPTDPASFRNKPSVGLLKITKETITPQIINL